MTTALGKLKKFYSKQVGVPVTSLRFLFDGKRINGEETPKSLGMKQDDKIEVYHEQTGGVTSVVSLCNTKGTFPPGYPPSTPGGAGPSGPLLGGP